MPNLTDILGGSSGSLSGEVSGDAASTISSSVAPSGEIIARRPSVVNAFEGVLETTYKGEFVEMELFGADKLSVTVYPISGTWPSAPASAVLGIYSTITPGVLDSVTGSASVTSVTASQSQSELNVVGRRSALVRVDTAGTGQVFVSMTAIKS